jgi:hypothetical protein
MRGMAAALVRLGLPGASPAAALGGREVIDTAQRWNVHQVGFKSLKA